MEVQVKQTILKNIKITELTLPNFKTGYKTTVIKIVQQQHRERHIGQWNRIENPEINSYIYGQMVF